VSDVVWSSVPAEPGHDLTEILYAEPSYEDRQKARREQGERDRLAARAQVAQDGAETHNWLGRLRGQGMPTVGDVLARARQDDGPDRSDAVRLRAARRVLREHGLEDVLGGSSGVIFDANMGTVERGGRLASEPLSRSAPELDDRQLQRAIAATAENQAFIARVKAKRATEISRSAGAPRGAASGGHGPGSDCQVCRAVYDASPIPPWARSS
jgi:hypothetical protein